MKRATILVTTLVLVVLLVTLVSGHGDFEVAESIIREKTPCSELSEQQLEQIGDYYMEQMHPGELHEIMDERMGGEGSESLRQVHINIGLSFYCADHDAFGPGMMNSMMGRPGGMMGNGVASGPYYGMMGGSEGYTGYGYNIMGAAGYGMYSWGWVGMLLFTALTAFIFGLVFWLTYTLVVGKRRR